MRDPQSWSLAIVVAVFAVSAIAVWLAGTRLAGYVAGIADRTGIGRAFAGMLLLGGITSLPELAVTLTSSLRGNAPLAVNNILGGVTMQVAILAIADVAIGRPALSSAVARPTVLLQGIFAILLLLIVAIGVGAGGPAVAGVGLWSAGVAVAFLVALWLVHRHGSSAGWQPVSRIAAEMPDGPAAADRADAHRSAPRRPPAEGSIAPLLLRVAVAGAVILTAGYLLSQTGEAIAERTGLGSSFIGATLVAISTSLPEVSSVVAAARIGDAELAFGDIFGTNMFDLALLFVVDVAYRGGPVLNEVGGFSQVAALLGALVTAIYVAGLIDRRNWSVARMGPDSIAAVLVYLGGLGLLYTLR